MHRLILLIILIAPTGLFAAENKPQNPASKVVTAEEDAQAMRGSRRARLAEIEAIEKSTAAARVAPLKALLSDKDPLVRGEAAQALGRSKAPAAFAELSAGLASEDDHTRWGAVEGLAALGDKRAVPPLIAALAHKDRYTRWKAAEALGGLKDERALEPLTGAANSDKNRNVRLAAIDALLSLGGARALSALEALRADPDPEVKARAAAAAGRLRK